MSAGSWVAGVAAGAAAATALFAGCSASDQRGRSRVFPEDGSGGSGVSASGGSPGTVDAGSPPLSAVPPLLPISVPNSSSCDLQRITAVTVAATVGAPVIFTNLDTGAPENGIQLIRVFGEAPSMGRTFVVTAHLSYRATDFTVTLNGGDASAGDGGPADAATAPDAMGVPVPAPLPPTVPDAGAPACESPRTCVGVPNDDPICRSGFPDRQGVTASGRMIRVSPLGDGGLSCAVETEPVGLPIGFGTFSCGISTNAVVLTASALYATCYCGLD